MYQITKKSKLPYGGKCKWLREVQKIDQKADLIWAIADKLTGVYKPHEYGEIILPLTVLRRFDCILADNKRKSS